MGRLNSALSSLADQGHFASKKAEDPNQEAVANVENESNSTTEHPQSQATDATELSSDSVVIEVPASDSVVELETAGQDDLQSSDAGELQVEIQLEDEAGIQVSAESSPEDTIVNSAPDRRSLKDEAELSSGTEGIEYLKDKLGLSDELLMAEPEPSRPEIENDVEDVSTQAAAAATPSVEPGANSPPEFAPPQPQVESASPVTVEVNEPQDSHEETASIEETAGHEEAVFDPSSIPSLPMSAPVDEASEAAEQTSSESAQELDPDSQEVMQLVEQVLGIRPDLRIDNSAPLEEQLAQLNELLATSPVDGTAGSPTEPETQDAPETSINIDASEYDEGVTIEFGESDVAYEEEPAAEVPGVEATPEALDINEEPDEEEFAGLEPYQRLMAGGFGVQNDASSSASPEESSASDGASDEAKMSASSGDSSDEPYKPVMEAWATIEQSDSDDEFVPPIAEEPSSTTGIESAAQQAAPGFVPPLTDDEALDELNRQVDDVSQSSILADLTSPNPSGTDADTPEPVTSISINIDEGGLVNELPPPVSEGGSSNVSRRESKPKTISEQIASQVVGADAAEEVESGNNLVPPSDYEIKLASKMVNSEFGEQVQGLAEQIMAEVDEDECQILMFVGMEQNRQRADIVSGLSMFVSPQREKPTLLIDADPESRVITRGFEQRGSGILEVIAGKSAWRHCTTPTGCQGLHMMPCGLMLDALDPSRGNQADLIAGAVDEWRQTYGLVMLDAGIAVSSLSRMLAKHSDSSFICVQIGKSPRELLVDTTEFLIRAGATVKGCITTNPR